MSPVLWPVACHYKLAHQVVNGLWKPVAIPAATSKVGHAFGLDCAGVTNCK